MGNTCRGTGVEELVRVINRCGVGVTFTEGVLWRAGADPAANWQSWQTLLFGPVILPHLVEVVDFALRQSLREIIQMDRSLEQYLSPALSARSQLAAARLCQGRPPRGDRMVSRFQDAIQAGETAGHFVTLFAIRAIAFSIPARTTIFAYILLELMLELSRPDEVEKLFADAAKAVNDYYGEGLNPPAEELHG
jgi:hypothetical protein